MEVDGNQTWDNWKDFNRWMDYRWDRRQTFFLLVFWKANKTSEKILTRSEKITDGSRYGIIWSEFFGHMKKNSISNNGILFPQSHHWKVYIWIKFYDNWSIKSIGTYWGTNTLATKSPSTPWGSNEKIWISNHGIIFPQH